MKIRLLTLFSGYDSQAMAMERLKENYPPLFDYQLVGWCEIDKNAIVAHDAVFPEAKGLNLGDICKVNPDDVPDCDCVTWSFPCQAISSAGKQEGFSEGSGTTSSLAWECMKIFRAKRPKYLLMENVKALTQKKFMPDFLRLQNELESMGYVNYWQVLNAKDYGVPQNRERVFMVSILKEGDETPQYHFPKPFALEKRVDDYMEAAKDVAQGYFLDQNRITRKVLSDLLQQPNVREELVKLYRTYANPD